MTINMEFDCLFTSTMLASTSEKVGVKLILFADTLRFVCVKYLENPLYNLEIENEAWPVRAF